MKFLNDSPLYFIVKKTIINFGQETDLSGKSDLPKYPLYSTQMSIDYGPIIKTAQQVGQLMDMTEIRFNRNKIKVRDSIFYDNG